MTRGAVSRHATGRWQGTPARVVDFRAGQLLIAGESGGQQFVHPSEFRADSGESGAELMQLLLPSPTVLDLYRGAIREALATVWSIGQIGRVDSRGWETPSDYIVNDSEGGLAFVRFTGEECVGAGFNDDPTRDYDLHAALASTPADLRPLAQQISALPFFAFNDIIQITALFWGQAGRLVGAEPWHILYTYSDTLRGELLTEESWAAEAGESYDLSAEATETIVDIARRAELPASPILIGAEALQTLIPADAPCRSEALDALAWGDVFINKEVV